MYFRLKNNYQYKINDYTTFSRKNTLSTAETNQYINFIENALSGGFFWFSFESEKPNKVYYLEKPEYHSFAKNSAIRKAFSFEEYQKFQPSTDLAAVVKNKNVTLDDLQNEIFNLMIQKQWKIIDYAVEDEAATLPKSFYNYIRNSHPLADQNAFISPVSTYVLTVFCRNILAVVDEIRKIDDLRNFYDHDFKMPSDIVYNLLQNDLPSSDIRPWTTILDFFSKEDVADRIWNKGENADNRLVFIEAATKITTIIDENLDAEMVKEAMKQQLDQNYGLTVENKKDLPKFNHNDIPNRPLWLTLFKAFQSFHYLVQSFVPADDLSVTNPDSMDRTIRNYISEQNWSLNPNGNDDTFAELENGMMRFERFNVVAYEDKPSFCDRLINRSDDAWRNFYAVINENNGNNSTALALAILVSMAVKKPETDRFDIDYLIRQFNNQEELVKYIYRINPALFQQFCETQPKLSSNTLLKYCKEGQKRYSLTRYYDFEKGEFLRLDNFKNFVNLPFWQRQSAETQTIVIWNLPFHRDLLMNGNSSSQTIRYFGGDLSEQMKLDGYINLNQKFVPSIDEMLSKFNQLISGQTVQLTERPELKQRLIDFSTSFQRCFEPKADDDSNLSLLNYNDEAVGRQFNRNDPENPLWLLPFGLFRFLIILQVASNYQFDYVSADFTKTKTFLLIRYLYLSVLHQRRILKNTLVVLIGDQGSGKSDLIRILKRIVGEAYCLDISKGEKDESTRFSAIRNSGKLISIIDDIQHQETIDNLGYKILTNYSELQTSEIKYGNKTVSYRLNAVPWIATNFGSAKWLDDGNERRIALFKSMPQPVVNENHLFQPQIFQGIDYQKIGSFIFDFIEATVFENTSFDFSPDKYQFLRLMEILDLSAYAKYLGIILLFQTIGRLFVKIIYEQRQNRKNERLNIPTVHYDGKNGIIIGLNFEKIKNSISANLPENNKDVTIFNNFKRYVMKDVTTFVKAVKECDGLLSKTFNVCNFDDIILNESKHQTAADPIEVRRMKKNYHWYFMPIDFLADDSDQGLEFLNRLPETPTWRKDFLNSFNNVKDGEAIIPSSWINDDLSRQIGYVDFLNQYLVKLPKITVNSVEDFDRIGKIVSEIVDGEIII